MSVPPVDEEAQPLTKQVKEAPTGKHIRPESLFKMLNGTEVDFPELRNVQFLYQIGSRAWKIMFDSECKATFREHSGTKQAEEFFEATVTYTSERGWIHRFSGKVSEMKLLVLGKLTINGDSALVAKVESMFEYVGSSAGADDPSMEVKIDFHAEEYKIEDKIIAELNQARRCAYFFYFVDDVAWGIFLTLVTFYLEERVTDGNALLAVALSSWTVVIYSISQFCTAPLLGTLTDIIGRKPVILSGAIFIGINFILWSVVTSSHWWTVCGIFMSLDGSAAACYTVIVDCAVISPATEVGGEKDLFITRWAYYLARPSNYDKKNPDLALELRAGMCVMLVYVLLGLLCGVILGDQIYYHYGVSWAMATAGLIFFPAFVFLYYYLPESLIATQRKEVTYKAFADAFVEQIKSVRMLKSSWALAIMAVFYFLANIQTKAAMNVLTYWAEDKYNWTENRVSVCLVGLFVSGAFLALFINSMMIPSMGFERAFTFCFLVAAFGCFFQNFAIYTWEIYVAIYAQGFAFAAYSLVLGMAATMVRYEEAGRLQGAMYAISTLGGLIGTTGSYVLYEATYSDNYGAPLWYGLGAICVLAATAGYSLLTVPRPRKLHMAHSQSTIDDGE